MYNKNLAWRIRLCRIAKIGCGRMNWKKTAIMRRFQTVSLDTAKREKRGCGDGNPAASEMEGHLAMLY